jgi:hypothetical protein
VEHGRLHEAVIGGIEVYGRKAATYNRFDSVSWCESVWRVKVPEPLTVPSAVDACRYFVGLLLGALGGRSKEQLLTSGRFTAPTPLGKEHSVP